MPFQLDRISPLKIPQLSKRDRDYWLGSETLIASLPLPFEKESFRQMVQQRKAYPTDRKLLQRELKRQYSGMHLPKGIEQNIDSLSEENTFTICTAHQPVLFTGPLYFVYKIVSTIALARILEEDYPEYRIVPVFILGSEDHDFEEMACAQLGEQSIFWEAEAGGPVGRLSTKTLKEPIQKLKEALNNHPIAQRAEQIFLKKHDRYGEAMAEFVHELFADYGLLVLQTDSVALKRSFVPHFRKELEERPSRERIRQTQEKLIQKGYKPQAHAREINLFYLTDKTRELILPEGEGFRLRHSGRFFSKAEMMQELEEHPERFSPHVVMRPLFQEHILPNLAYVGGGGELAYWMERPAQFRHFGIPFPILVRRNSALWLSPNDVKIMQKTKIRPEELFEEPQKVVDRQLLKQAGEAIQFQQEKEKIRQAFRQMEEKAKRSDPTLTAAVRARAQHVEKEVEKLEKKLLKAERRKREDQLRRLQKLHNRLFPKGKLQERHENILPYLAEYGQACLDFMVREFNPFDRAFYLIKPAFPEENNPKERP